MSSFFKYDYYRYYGKYNYNIVDFLLFPMELKYIYFLRRYQSCKSKLLSLFFIIMLKRISNKTLIQIPKDTSIGKGFYIGHTGRLIINSKVKIGNNVNVSTGVTIGKENRGKRIGSPTIKNNVWIGTNSVIVGNITIGEDVLIAPLTFVNFDVPDHSIVIGNPAKIIKQNEATKDYINNIINNIEK